MSTLSDPQQEAKDYHPRFRIFYGVLLISAVLIFCRLWYLQIIQGQELWQTSNQNRVKKSKIPAPRGVILDREGRILVDNLPGFVATISPQYATRLKETAEAVGPILEISPSKIVNTVKISRRKNGPFREVKIKENLSLEEVYRLQFLRFEHPGLNIQEAILRHYPLQENGAQLFGYVGEISKRQIPRYNKKYRNKFRFEQGDLIGKSGVEEVWETFLRGNDGLSFLEVDAYGRQSNYTGDNNSGNYMGLSQQEEIPGHNLVLTIDKDIQEAAYNALLREDRWAPRVGTALVMKSNGEVLAWASVPSFDPNEFSKGISSQLWKSLRNDPFKPLFNKIAQNHFAPGSTLKPLIALAALQEKELTKSQIIYAPGQMRYGRRTYHDSIRAGHGNITVYEAIERSSNIFFFKMGIALGIDRMAKYADLFGLGKKTGINMSGEVPGLFPTKEWKLKRTGEPWQPGENLSNAIGQGFVLTTSLQLALAYNAIGLEGKLYKPFLVKKIIDHENRLVKEFSEELRRDLSVKVDNQAYIEPRHFKVVKEAMRLVANGSRGTARHWKVPGLEMAGKTGTSQVMSFSADEIYKKCENRPLHQRHHGTYVMYAPADKPEIAIAVMIEHGCHGNTAGAPVARDITKAYFEKYHPEWLKKKKTPAPKKPVAQAKPETEESTNAGDEP